MGVLLNPSYEYRALTHDLPFIILCRKIVNKRYPTKVTPAGKARGRALSIKLKHMHLLLTKEVYCFF